MNKAIVDRLEKLLDEGEKAGGDREIICSILDSLGVLGGSINKASVR